VLCEANAFGVPVLTSDVGGIPSVVRSGVNGFTAPLRGWTEAIVRSVVALWRDPASYQALARSARQEYDRRLNWTTLGERISAEIRCSLASQ
jgi:glycosyltransferase involved in cell wall biosynthesis